MALEEAVRKEEIYSLHEPGEGNRSIAEEHSWIEGIRENPQHLLLVAVNTKDTPEGPVETLLGYIEVHSGNRRRISHTAEFGMAVARPYRNQGVGRMLIQGMMEWAHENPQIEKISLKVHHDNERAIHLYQSMGFFREGVLKCT